MTEFPPTRNDSPFADGFASVPSSPLRHSGLAIASFVIGMGTVVLMLLTFMAAAVLHIRGHTDNSGGDVGIMLIGLAIICLVFIALIGVILGIIGVAQRDRKKLFAWWGLSVNMLIVLCTIGLMVLGYAAKHRG